MREIPKKNYYILVVLLVVTVVLTMLLSNLYLNKEKMVSNFYEYSNKITPQEFDEYITENPDLIIYISDKYDLAYETFETNFQNKINNLNLKENLIYINKSDIDEKFMDELKKSYNINIDLNNIPIIIVVIDKSVIKNVSITNDSNVDAIIEYGAFE